MNEKNYLARQLVQQIHGELDYIERYTTKLKVKLVELESLLNDDNEEDKEKVG